MNRRIALASRTERPDRPAGWHYHPTGRTVAQPLDLVVALDEAARESVHMVFARDGAYVPAVIRLPQGQGPFPAVVCLHGGSGGLGWSFLARELHERPLVYDRLTAEGYAVCVTEGRMEREDEYGTGAPAALDYQDVCETFRYLQRLPEIDAERIGFFGVSHGGELQLKVIAELGDGPAALVPTEPAAIEFLGLKHDGGSDADDDWTPEDSSGPRTEERMQFNRPVGDDEIDLEAAQERVAGVSDSVAILVLGRDDDHLQGVFRKSYELLERAGKRVEWDSFDHPEHAYQWGPRSRESEPDEVQRATLERLVSFLNANVRDR